VKTDYDYYLMGCRYMEAQPLSRWRFAVAYAKYWQLQRLAADQAADPKRQSRIVRRWHLLRSVADLVERGKDIAARAGRFENGEDEPGSAGAGDREPRAPLAPVLCGCGARSLPYPDPNAFVERQW